jgi:hypothetical protein
MPKGKHATALFEVINPDRRPGTKAPVLRTPAWWNKNKPAASAVPAASPPASIPATAPAADMRALEPARRPFKLTYRTGLIIGGAAVLGIVILLLASHHGDHPAVSESSTDELLKGPAQPQVMNIKRGEQGLTPAVVSGNDGNPANGNGTSSNNATPLPPDGKRMVGLNYVVVQSYPDEKGAEEARDVLIKAGIPATIEQKLRGFHTTWYTVVGTEGFNRVKSAEFTAYIKKIEKVSDSFAKKKSFKAFTPLPYKWDKTE